MYVKRMFVIMVASFMMVLTGCGNLVEKEVTEQLSLGEKYLSELNYEQAIDVYKNIIEIDPKNEEAYLGLAEVYAEQGLFEDAIELLEKAKEEMSSDSIDIRIDEIAVLFDGSEVELVDSAETLDESEISPTELITETVYNVDGSYTVFEYDVNGNQTKISSYDVEENLLKYSIYEYDAAGERELVQSHFDSEGSLLMTYTSEYNGNGEKVKSINNKSDESYDETIYSYDESGNMIESNTLQYDVNGNLKWSFMYEYDSTGNRVKWTNFSSDASVMDYHTYEYDSSGMEVKGYWFSGDGTMKFYFIPTYSADGTKVKEDAYDPDGNLAWITEYDKNGVPIN